ncbi:MAG TPA: DUF4197 domain-containing protein [Mariprofundaceae bacterium]|nr:DUF4197 domain-containing protein [Mariprofundaceae bacterium]
MAARHVLSLWGMMVIMLPANAWGGGYFDNWLEDAGKVIQGNNTGAAGLSQADIMAGLKQALEHGTARTVRKVGHLDGFWKNSSIRIPLPEKLQRPALLLKKAGMGSYAEDLQLRINRAAEAAVPLAKPVFLDAIRRMSFSDAKGVWKGPDDAATRYFQNRTTAPLSDAFLPIVHKELQRSGAIRSWRKFASQYAGLPFIGGYLHDDLDAYATRMALSGIFTILAVEEKKIRHDPAARTTDLLRRVFR